MDRRWLPAGADPRPLRRSATSTSERSRNAVAWDGKNPVATIFGLKSRGVDRSIQAPIGDALRSRTDETEATEDLAARSALQSESNFRFHCYRTPI
jgi:hypothetical protein